MTTDPTIQGFSLSPLQQHLWRTQSSSGSANWNVVAHVRVTSSEPNAGINADGLRAAIERVAARTELLRTEIHELEGTHVAVQSIHDTPRLRFEQLDGDPLDAERALTRDPFDVRAAEVLRVALVGTDRIVIAQPSLVADAASVWNLVREIAAELAGSSPTEDDEAMQFADIAQWLNDNLASEDAAPGVELWKRVDWTAAELAIPLALPRTNGDGQHASIERIVREWSDADREALASAARTVGVEPASILSAAWQLTLARAAGRDKIVTGDFSLGREFEGLGDALGPFGRPLPLASRIDANQSFADFARAVDAARVGAREWHEAFDHDASLSFGFEWRDRVEPVTAGELTFELLERSVLAEPCELAVELDLGVHSPELALLFDSARYGTQDAATILRQFDTLLTGACAAPATPVGGFSLLAADEREEILLELAPGDAGAALDAPVHAVIASWAEQTPDAVAAWANGRALTFAELDALSNRIARRLRGLGIGAGDFVGLYLGRSIEQIAAILGVLKAGGAYLPLPPGYPAERIAFMLEDTAARVVLTRSADRGTLPAFDGTVVTIDDDAPLEAEDAGPLDAPFDSYGGAEHMASPAYVIFTSGSTGKPKGVAISHANLAHSTGARLAFYEQAITSYLLVSSFAFDSSVVGIFWTLCQGGKLVLPDDGFEQDIPAIAALVDEHAVSHMLALPSLWGLMLDTSEHAKLASLGTVIVAGESCPPELVRSHASALPDTRLFNEYGPTEATVWSTVFDCTGGSPRATVPIGRPIPGASAFVVDSSGELCPIGIAGELWIGGAGVAAGYLGRPELTAERFVSAPYVERAYRTGDLARLLPDGNLEFLGRIDTQVKIRGYRIELEEIESTLASHTAIREAVVLAREDTPGDVRLVAYTTQRPNAPEVSASDLRAHLDVTLPDYMVPARFVVLDEFPQLPNGKTDRGALPAPDQDRSSATAEYVAPATPLEKVLAAIWSDVLKVERVGADDDFFDLGGHSILATQLFARMVDMLQVKVPLRSIFDARTLRGLAQLILSDADEGPRVERTAELVLSVLEAPDDE